MSGGSSGSLVVAAVLLLLLASCAPHPAHADPLATLPADKAALLAFKNALIGPAPALATWDAATDPCAALWTGVICVCSQIRSTAVTGCAADSGGYAR